MANDHYQIKYHDDTSSVARSGRHVILESREMDFITKYSVAKKENSAEMDVEPRRLNILAISLASLAVAVQLSMLVACLAA